MNRSRNLTHWILGTAICLLLPILALIIYLSRLSDGDHHNLRYLMWKAGLRDYNATEVLSGTRHDHQFHNGLKGIGVKEFQSIFPATFHKLNPSPPGFGNESEFFASSRPSVRSPKAPLPAGWIAHFINGKLDSFGYHKNGP